MNCLHEPIKLHTSVCTTDLDWKDKTSATFFFRHGVLIEGIWGFLVIKLMVICKVHMSPASTVVCQSVKINMCEKPYGVQD